MPVARLDDRAVIALSGPEARSFLQGLITNDVDHMEPGRGLYAALLTPQGKILFDFFLTEGDGAILIDCARTSCEQLVRRLTMYRLRARVTIEIRDQLEVLAEWDGASVASAIAYDDPRVPALGRRAIGAAAEMPTTARPAQAYHERRLELGVPEGLDFGSDRIFALDADLDELHAVAFDKGCYVGQELTARMKHRGTARKRLLPFSASDGVAVSAGDGTVTAGGREIGEITSVCGTQGFALIRLDRLDEAGGAQTTVGETAVKIRRPEWLFA